MMTYCFEPKQQLPFTPPEHCSRHVVCFALPTGTRPLNAFLKRYTRDHNPVQLKIQDKRKQKQLQLHVGIVI